MSATIGNSVRVSIEKLGVESGDLLIIKFPDGSLSYEAAMVGQELKKNLEAAGKELVNIIVLPNDWDIQELTTEQLDDLGLCRKENRTLN